jgi:hypothetical protein
MSIAPRKQQRKKLFATLTCIRQTGTRREWNGTTTYSFVATITKDGPPVVITLTVTPALVLQVQAHFDATMQEEARELHANGNLFPEIEREEG